MKKIFALVPALLVSVYAHATFLTYNEIHYYSCIPNPDNSCPTSRIDVSNCIGGSTSPKDEAGYGNVRVLTLTDSKKTQLMQIDDDCSLQGIRNMLHCGSGILPGPVGSTTPGECYFPSQTDDKGNLIQKLTSPVYLCPVGFKSDNCK